MTTQTQTHPTKDEWLGRRAGAPTQLTELTRRIESESTESRKQSDAEWRVIAELLVARRQGFEKRLADVLDSEGCGWLAPHRKSDVALVGPYRLELSQQVWFAGFHLDPVGFHDIRIELHHRGDTDQWFPAVKPFGVDLPAGTRWFRTFREAIRCASEYVACPF